jgi:hypothetical protein
MKFNLCEWHFIVLKTPHSEFNIAAIQIKNDSCPTS